MKLSRKTLLWLGLFLSVAAALLPGLQRGQSRAADECTGAYCIYLPIILKPMVIGLPIVKNEPTLTPTPTPTNTPTPTPSPLFGIRGAITYQGQSMPDIAVDLVRYIPGTSGSSQPIARATTDWYGRYAFPSAPTLSGSYVYYIRYINDADDPRFLGVYYGPDIKTYNAGENRDLASFDISDIVLASPAAGAGWGTATVFYWNMRSVTTDSYRLCYRGTTSLCTTTKLGYVNNARLSAPADNTYVWYVIAYAPDTGMGFSRESRAICSPNACAAASITSEELSTINPLRYGDPSEYR